MGRKTWTGQKDGKYCCLDSSYTGAQVVSRLLIQLRKKGLSKELEECQSVDYSNGNFILNGASNDYYVEAAILATGLSPSNW